LRDRLLSVISSRRRRLGVYQNAFPILRRNGQKAIMFLISAEVYRVVKGYVSWQMVSEMQAIGLVTFGSHTVHHAMLSQLSTQRVLMETGVFQDHCSATHRKGL
jgi:peptidoglycan/xylan/chitin deacetylase (PgdA/CDA1 family)